MNFFKKKLNEDWDESLDDKIVTSSYDYYLIQEDEKASNGEFEYKVYDGEGNMLAKWTSPEDAMNMNPRDFNATKLKQKFKAIVDHEYSMSKIKQMNKFSKWWKDEEDDEYNDYDLDSFDSFYDNKYPTGYRNYDKTFKPWTPSYMALEEAIKKYCNSNTLVIHKTDPTTTMLDQIYKGKGWDVVNNVSEISSSTWNELIKRHERIVMLGHGTGGGLIGSIGPSNVEALKGKNVFVIWCNANKFFERYLPEMKGKFITKNAPSEVWECEAAGCGNISAELMLENITYWCKLCGDVVEDCLNGNVDKSVDYIRKNYLEKYGNHPVTIFNADSAHKFGFDKPLPKYKFKGKKLEPKDYPYPNFDEEEFLKNPTADIKVKYEAEPETISLLDDEDKVKLIGRKNEVSLLDDDNVIEAEYKEKN